MCSKRLLCHSTGSRSGHFAWLQQERSDARVETWSETARWNASGTRGWRQRQDSATRDDSSPRTMASRRLLCHSPHSSLCWSSSSKWTGVDLNVATPVQTILVPYNVQRYLLMYHVFQYLCRFLHRFQCVGDPVSFQHVQIFFPAWIVESVSGLCRKCYVQL